MSPLAEPVVGQELPRSVGRYDVISTLGVGGMAQIFLAMQRGPASSSRLVAIKRLRADMAGESQFLTMFADEARLALRLSHPNVVHTYEVVAESDGLFIAMELLQGQPLSGLLRRIGRENMPLDEHLWILTQVLAGLHHAHTLADFDGTPLKIVHRDVSPSNVIVTYAGEVKLVDFGIAKATVARTATQAGVIKGKLGYAAPEQCLGSSVDGRSDIFAVGIMLWEALAGRRRSVADTALAQIQARVRDEELAIEAVRPDVAPELAEITRRALALKPEGRFESALEMQQALERYLRAHAPAVGQDVVRALMKQHFDAEMTSFRRSLEAYLRARPKGEDDRDVSGGRPAVVREAATHSLEPSSLSNSGTVPNGTLRRESESEFVFRRKPLRLPIVVALLSVFVFAGAFALSRSVSKKDGADPALAARAPSSAPSVGNPSVEPPRAAAPSASAAEVTADMAVASKSAGVRLDGRPPRVPQSGRVGVRPASPEVTGQRAPKGPQPTALSEEPARKAAPAGGAEPGQDLRAGTLNTRAARQIDEKDPYSP